MQNGDSIGYPVLAAETCLVADPSAELAELRYPLPDYAQAESLEALVEKAFRSVVGRAWADQQTLAWVALRTQLVGPYPAGSRSEGVGNLL